MQPIITKVGKFTITVSNSEHADGRYQVSITPGTTKMRATSGKFIHIKCTIFYLHSYDSAMYQRAVFIRYANNETAAQMWDRLNRAPLAVYNRFQRFAARRNNGKHIRGLNIHAGKVKLNFE